MKKKRFLEQLFQNIVLVLMALVFITPLYVSVVNAFKESKTVMSSPLSVPIPPILDNIKHVLSSPNAAIGEMYSNTFILMLFATVLCVLVSALAAYYLARTKTKFSRFMSTYFLIGLMVPYIIVFIPMATMMRVLHIPFGIPVLILVFAAGNISFSVFMYTNFIRSLPTELEESAAIDGASKFRAFWSVLFPLLKPCTATVCIFTGLGVWNDFMTPLILGQVKTITVGIYTAIGPYSADWGIVFSYVLFAAVPVIVIYLLMQKQFIAGLTAGATKG